ncbi:MAG: hypothetical protein IKJ64_05140, partial [Bacteroidales bacterium]|nr:hypothetical protein [Bacteroidales bacterium]
KLKAQSSKLMAQSSKFKALLRYLLYQSVKSAVSFSFPQISLMFTDFSVSKTLTDDEFYNSGTKAFELKFKVQSSEFKAQSSKFKAQSSKFKAQSSKFKAQSFSQFFRFKSSAF